MDFSYNRFNELEDIELILCNPNGTEMAVLEAENRIVTLRLNDLSELTFDVYKYTKRKDGTEEVSPYYDMIETRRLVHVTNIGWFLITKVEEIEEADYTYKAVSCQSHQVTFQDFGFITEERVYKFYDPSNPHDAGYDSTDIGAIPSVVGQMYQQLMVDQDISSTDRTPTSDYGIWTLTYIDPALWWDESRDDNVARTFTDKTTNGFDFMVNLAEDAFEIVFLFDFEYHTIKVKQVQDITKMSDILLSFSNVLSQMDVTEDATDLVTVLDCTGDGLDITLNNPMGTNYIVDFSYYMQETTDEYGNTIYPWMSKELIDALNDWQVIYDECKEPYQELVKVLRAFNQRKVEIEATITYYNTELLDIQNILDQIYTANKAKEIEDGVPDEDADPGDTINVNGDEIFTAEEVLAGAYSLDPNSIYHTQRFYSDDDGTKSRSHTFYKDDDNFERGYRELRIYTREPDPNVEGDEGEYVTQGLYVLSGTTRTRTVENNLDITEDTGKSNTQPSELHDDKSLINYPYFIDYQETVQTDKIRDTLTITDDGVEADDGTLTSLGYTAYIVWMTIESQHTTSFAITVYCPESTRDQLVEVKVVAWYRQSRNSSGTVATKWYLSPVIISVPAGSTSARYDFDGEGVATGYGVLGAGVDVTEVTIYTYETAQIDANEGSSYCKLQPEVTSIEYDIEDDDNYTVTYDVKSFIRYASYNDAWRWKEIYDNALEVANGKLAMVEDAIANVEEAMDEIVQKCNLMNYFADRPDLLRELRNYWAEGSYTNNNLAVLDDMTIADMIDLGNELMEYGAIELSKVCQPRFKFSVESLKFIMLPEFKDFTQQLEMGRVITVEKSEGLWYYPALTEMQFSLDDFEDFTMTFSNRLRLDDWGYTYADLITSAASTTKTVANNWVSALTSYERRAESIDGLLREPLNATLRLAEANMYNQSFVIDDTGILGRKYTDDSQTTFNDEQMRITNNVIIFTDDRWETIKTALGMIVYNDYTDLDEDGKPKTKTAYGLLAEVLVGELILGETLEIVNETGTVRIDKDGITVTTADGTDIFRVNINGDPYIRTYLTESEASLTYETQTSANSTTTRLEGLITTNTSLINQTANEIYAEVSTVQKNLQANINTVDGKVTENSSAILSVTERVSSLEMTSDSITATITGIEKVVGITLDSDGNVVVEGASIVDQISQIDMRLDSITLTVGSTEITYSGTLEEVLEKVANAFDEQLGYTNGSLGELQGALTGSDGNLINIQKNVLDPFDLEIDNLQDALTGDDGGLINVQTVVEKVASIDMTVDSITDTVSSIQTKYDGEITEIQTNISTLEQTATSITAMVTEEYAKKQDGSTVSSQSFGYVLTSSGFSLVSNNSTVFYCDNSTAYIVGFDIGATGVNTSTTGFSASVSWVSTGTSEGLLGSVLYTWRLDLRVTRTSNTNNTATATVRVTDSSAIGGLDSTYTVSFDKGVTSATVEGVTTTSSAASSTPSTSNYSVSITSAATTTGGYIAFGKSSYNDSNEGVYLGTDGIGLGPGNFWVNSSGTVHIESSSFGLDTSDSDNTHIDFLNGTTSIKGTSVTTTTLTAENLYLSGTFTANGINAGSAGLSISTDRIMGYGDNSGVYFNFTSGSGSSNSTVQLSVSVSQSTASAGMYNVRITVSISSIAPSGSTTTSDISVLVDYVRSVDGGTGSIAVTIPKGSGAGSSVTETFQQYGGVSSVRFSGTNSTSMTLAPSSTGYSIGILGDLVPTTSYGGNLGTSSYPWNAVYSMSTLVDTSSNTSDYRLKHDIVDLDEQSALNLIRSLDARAYSLNRTPDVTDYGFIAQEVEEAMHELGLDSSGIVHAPEGDDSYYSLNYIDLIAPMVKVIQYILKKIQ